MKLNFRGKLADALASLEEFDRERGIHSIGMIYAAVTPELCTMQSLSELWLFEAGESVPSTRGKLVQFLDLETALDVSEQGDLLGRRSKRRKLTAEERFMGVRYYAANDAYLSEDDLFRTDARDH